jgi:hypothetical protein
MSLIHIIEHKLKDVIDIQNNIDAKENWWNHPAKLTNKFSVANATIKGHGEFDTR